MTGYRADDTHTHALALRNGYLRICERARSKSDAIFKHDRVINDNGSDKAPEARFVVTRSSTLEVPRRRDSHIEKGKPRRVFSIPHKFSFKSFFCKTPQYAAEPESYLSCDGFNCRPEGTQTRPHVVSISLYVDLAPLLTVGQITISACQDPEQTWDSRKGFTLTRVSTSVHILFPGSTANARSCLGDDQSPRSANGCREPATKHSDL